MRLLRWLWHGDRALAQSDESRLMEAGARTALLWLLALWTLLSGVALIFLEGRVTRTLAGGLSDHPGQRLLGAQWLGLAAVYAFAALRGRHDRTLTWLAAAVQVATGLVTAYTLLSGQGSGGTAFVCVVAFAFGLLLIGFLLAGQPAYFPAAYEQPPHDQQPYNADARTERFDFRAPHDAAQQPTPAATPAPDDAPTKRLPADDDEPLGL